jgi:hypothetical protein
MSPSSQEPEGRDLFVHLGEQLIAKLEAQPITITYVFSDGTRTYEVKPEDPLYKELSRRRREALRGSLAKLRGKGGKT